MRLYRLALLVALALLSTSIEPFHWMKRSVDLPLAAHEAVIAAESLPAVSSGLPATFDGPRGRDALEMSADEQLAEKYFRRLSNRHTGLAKHERVRVARAIVREAHAHDLDPDLVIAVIEVESAGYHLAVSHVGALGLMQLLPSTARELADRHGIPWKGDDMLFDPVINIRLGSAYLRHLADHYDGNVSVALAAYNWGPGRIDRRLRRGASVPSKYIDQVMRAYLRNTSLASRSS